MTRGKPVGLELHLDLHDDVHLALTTGRVEFLSMCARGLVEPRVMRDVGRVQADVKFAARPHVWLTGRDVLALSAALPPAAHLG